MNPPYFLFDIGASHTRIGISHDGEKVESTQIYPTPQSFDEGVATLSQKMKQLGEGLKYATGGIAGPLSPDKTMITGAPNLPDWNNKPFVAKLKEATGAEIKLENDTALVGLGESVDGPGKSFNIAAYMTVSTGVNGVLVLNKKIAPNARGYEIGNQLVDFDKTYDSDSNNFEDLVAGSQFERRFGAKAHEIHDPNVWNEEANLVSVGLTNLILFWSPEIVILGGSVAKSIPLDVLIEKTRERLTIFPTLPIIKKAELGDFAGLWGALHFAKSL
jgi:predicted NBD/HSP70 family sugar kinase